VDTRPDHLEQVLNDLEQVLNEGASPLRTIDPIAGAERQSENCSSGGLG